MSSEAVRKGLPIFCYTSLQLFGPLCCRIYDVFRAPASSLQSAATDSSAL